MIAASIVRQAIAQRSAAQRIILGRRALVVTASTTTSTRSFSSPAATTDLATTKDGSTLAKTSSDGVVGVPIDFDVAAKIEGNESQIVTITLQPGQVLRAESGAMMYMTDGVQMETTTGGGLSSGFQRMLTGQNFFISDYTYKGDSSGAVALGTDFPSKIVRLNVEEYGGKLVCQKGALLCASHTIDIKMEYSKNFSTGFFGGEGFILQVRLSSLLRHG
jgi:Mitochondrial biogenesis AIM24